MVAVEGAAGTCKTALLDVARVKAEQAGMGVLVAHGTTPADLGFEARVLRWLVSATFSASGASAPCSLVSISVVFIVGSSKARGCDRKPGVQTKQVERAPGPAVRCNAAFRRVRMGCVPRVAGVPVAG